MLKIAYTGMVAFALTMTLVGVMFDGPAWLIATMLIAVLAVWGWPRDGR